MKIAIMQPYFLPYIGYYQLIREVDYFVLTDNYQYSKGGWINRNRIKQNNEVKYLTLPISAGSDYLTISQRSISSDFSQNRLLNQIENSYRKSIYFDETFKLLEKIITHKETNLFKFLENSLQELLLNLEISTKILLTSDFSLSSNLTKEEKIIHICKELRADCYINLPGGKKIYKRDVFQQERINLKFIKPNLIPYIQLGSKKTHENEFVSNLSIIDVLFYAGVEETKNTHLMNYQLET
jgi:hypothetical protein